jgi:uncharacterized small protein (DUF1192 family)
MNDDRSTGHDDVMSSLLDLQARLRGGDAAADESPASTEGAADVARRTTVSTATPEPVTVVERDLSILMGATPASTSERLAPVTQLPTAAVADDRIAALTQRLSRLEGDLSEVIGALGTMREEVASDTDERIGAVRREVTRTLTERLDAVESRVVDELRVQREDLTGLVGERFRSMDERLHRAIREVAEPPSGD